MTEQNASPDTDSARTEPAALAGASLPLPLHSQRSAFAALPWLVAIVVVLVVLAMAAAGAGAYLLNRKLDHIGQHQQAGDAQLRAQVDATAQQASAQMDLLRNRLADDEASQQALARQYADLAHNHDDWMLTEAGQILTNASEQLALTGNTKRALAALQNVDARLATSGSAQVIAVRQTIATDISRLKAAPSIDLAGLALKLDGAVSQVDTLPLAGEAPVTPQAPQITQPGLNNTMATATATAKAKAKAKAAAHDARWKTWLRQFTAEAGQQLAGLVQVRRIDNADAMLVSPEQGNFVRENLKLRLLSARVSLLSHNDVTLKADLRDADAALMRYFDHDAKSTQALHDLLRQVQAGANAAALPNLDDSLRAIQSYQSRG
jgi:uroporphyrinogen III methyltransferase/synthase